MQVDINCDLGESYGRFRIGSDEDILPFVDSCNIACGFHGGDPLTIEKTILLAKKWEKRIGAHPSYPDLSGFGRRSMVIPGEELTAIIRYQIAALQSLCAVHGTLLSYVKPHGALYNDAARNPEIGKSIIKAVQSFEGLEIMGLAGSPFEDQVKQAQLPFLAEAFADRTYTSNGHLVSRSHSKAVIQDPEQAVVQVLSIVNEKKVPTIDGNWIPLEANTFCIHGDNPAASEIIIYLRKVLKEGRF